MNETEFVLLRAIGSIWPIIKYVRKLVQLQGISKNLMVEINCNLGPKTFNYFINNY